MLPKPSRYILQRTLHNGWLLYSFIFDAEISACVECLWCASNFSNTEANIKVVALTLI
jgi:hypothetical protein